MFSYYFFKFHRVRSKVGFTSESYDVFLSSGAHQPCTATSLLVKFRHSKSLWNPDPLLTVKWYVWARKVFAFESWLYTCYFAELQRTTRVLWQCGALSPGDWSVHTLLCSEGPVPTRIKVPCFPNPTLYLTFQTLTWHDWWSYPVNFTTLSPAPAHHSTQSLNSRRK